MSTYTTSIGLELQPVGGNNNIWGGRNNTNFGLVEERVDGVATVTVTGNWSLTISNGLASEGRKHVQLMVGTPVADFTVTLPARVLNRIFVNRTGRTATITTGSGTTATVRDGQSTTIWSDGTDVSAIDPRLNTILAPNGPVAFNNQRATGLATPTGSADAATKGYVDTFTADRSAGGFKLANLANGTANTQDAATVNQVQGLIAAAAAINLPSPTGQAGRFLTTNGTVASWSLLDEFAIQALG